MLHWSRSGRRMIAASPLTHPVLDQGLGETRPVAAIAFREELLARTSARLAAGGFHPLQSEMRGAIWASGAAPLWAAVAGTAIPSRCRPCCRSFDPASGILRRDYGRFVGPPLVFGRSSVFSTAGDDPLHARRQALVVHHLGFDMLRLHAVVMQRVWARSLEQIVAMPAGCRAVRPDINAGVLRTVQEIAIRCWMGVEPSELETSDTLARYYDPGQLLSEALFDSWYFLRARRRIRTLRTSYAPLLSRSLDAMAATFKAEDPHLRFMRGIPR